MMMYDWASPGMYGPLHWLLFVAFVVVVVYPIGRILRRIGFSPLWSVLVFVPVLNVLGVWILAFTDWPKRSDSQQS
jgi:hypothetical protein